MTPPQKKCFQGPAPWDLCGWSGKGATAVSALLSYFFNVGVFGGFGDPVVLPERGAIGDVVTIYPCWDGKGRFLQPLALPRVGHGPLERRENTVFTKNDLHGLAEKCTFSCDL